MVKLRVLVHRPKVREMKLDYPFIRLMDWAQYLLQHHSEHVLGGHNIHHVAEYTAMFQQFWKNYYNLDPGHECYVKFKKFADMGSLIPYCIHGDEGRGKAKNPILITAYQFVIGVHGEQHTNMKGYPVWPCVVWCFCLSLVFPMIWTCLHCTWKLETQQTLTRLHCTSTHPRHSFSTRWLSSLMPSKNFAKKDATLDDMCSFMVGDLQQAFYHGVTVSCFQSRVEQLLKFRRNTCGQWQHQGLRTNLLLLPSWHQRRLAVSEKNYANGKRIPMYSQVSLLHLRRSLFEFILAYLLAAGCCDVLILL